MNKKSFQFTIEPWSIEYENKEYQTPIFNLLQRKMVLESAEEHNEGEFYVLEAPEWVNVIPITTDGKVVLVEQYRYGIEQPTLEIPGGIVDPGELPHETAERELLEETGYQSDSWINLGKVSANPAMMNNFSHVYLAEACQYEELQNPDQHERIHVHLLQMDTFLDYVADGTISHSIVVAAVAKYMLRER